MSSLNSPSRFVADIGGTNSRLAVFDQDSCDYRHLKTYLNCDYDSLAQIIATWRDSLDETPPKRACIAVAAAPAGDQVSMSSTGWRFSRAAIDKEYGFEHSRWLNDFEANAYSLPYLSSADYETIRSGSLDSTQGLAVAGPGTGFGGAALRWANRVPKAYSCEPGHGGLSPANGLELEVFRVLLQEHHSLYSELVNSGPGLVNLYSALAKVHGATLDRLEPAQIAALALEGNDTLAKEALTLFCSFVGSACGDFLVHNGVYGGLFIAGGVIPRMIPFLRTSPFLERLQNKGKMSSRLASLPVNVITADFPGLIGAAYAPLDAIHGT